MSDGDEVDFRDLLRAVLIIRQNMELNYDSFRHSRDLDECWKLLRRLAKQFGLE